MNRRDFFDLSQLARTAGEAVAALHEPPPRELALLRFARQAMATQFEVVLPFGTPRAFEMAEDALDEIDRIEEQLSVYRAQSEVSRLNCAAADGPVSVEERLFNLLARAARISAETSGAFDVTAGPLIKTWGFFRREGRVPTPEERAEVLQRVGMAHLGLDAERRTVAFRRPGIEVNLGSIGKGYALDRAAAILRRDWGVPTGLLHGGHSSVYAIGTEPGDSRGWSVGIRHPWQPDRRIAIVHLKDQGLATSAATFQHLEHNGRKLGHILDPRTGWPAEGTSSATVLAPTAAEADALATAFYVRGVEAARDYCVAHPGIGAVVLPEGAGRPVVVGLSPDIVELC